METLYIKVAVSDLEKLMEDSLTIKKRGGEYRTALNHILNISQDLDEIQLQKDKEALENRVKILKTLNSKYRKELGRDETPMDLDLIIDFPETIKSNNTEVILNLQKHKEELLEMLEKANSEIMDCDWSENGGSPHLQPIYEEIQSLIQKHKS